LTTAATPLVSAEALHSFGPLPVTGPVARALAAMRYTTPTPIQEQAIPPLRAGRDVLGQAQTGTGKTAGFGIPLIEVIDARVRAVQAIVLVPTRELCLQVAQELARLGQYTGVRVLPVYGGVGLGPQTAALVRGIHVVVGTPGRVEDHLQRGTLTLDRVRVAVLDEADRMLDVGFLPAIERILRCTPAARQTALFSATIPEEVRGLAHRQMRNPVTIAITPERPTVDLIAQRFEPVPHGDKLAALTAHLDSPHCALALVFRRTTHKADRLARDLSRRGYRVAVLHGRRTQGQRERVLSQLKVGALQALVATDIAARGLDIAGLTHVFNYDLPDTPETYVHRIGRTGRAGESGVAITLVAREDEDGVRSIERYLARRRGGPTGAPGEGRRTAHTSIRRDATRTATPSPRDAAGQRPRPAQGEPARHAAAPTAQETTDAAPRSQRRRRRHWSSGPRPTANAS
jgi:ATP-dependent RNA helicase DeaD